MATKKFGRGGDILTALGAGLTGYGLYKHFTKDKDDEYARKVREYEPVPKPEISEEVEKARKAKPVATETEGERRAKAVSQGRPEMGEVTEDMKKDVDIKRVGAAKPVRSLRKPQNTAPATTTTTQPADKATTTTTTQPADKAGTGDEGAEVKKTPHEKFLSGKGITTPGDPNKKGSTAKGRSENPIQGTIDNRSKSMARTPQQKMSENAREVQRRREEAEKSRYKKGGAVKSASARADGIAIRGKTRGKVC